MRRLLFSAGSAMLLTFAIAGSAFAAHCINENKPEGAGVHGVVLLDPVTFAPTLLGANPGCLPPGGFTDTYIDVDDSGTLTEADVQIENDVFLISNRSHKENPAQGIPAVLPSVQDDRDPAGPGRGVGVAHHE